MNILTTPSLPSSTDLFDFLNSIPKATLIEARDAAINAYDADYAQRTADIAAGLLPYGSPERAAVEANVERLQTTACRASNLVRNHRGE